MESLERRRLLVVGAFAIPPAVAPGSGFDGVVDLSITTGGGTSRCTGNLLEGARHISTAAHCVTDGTGAVDATDVDVTFEMPAGDIRFDTNLAAMQVHPSWTGATTSVGDLAILELEALPPLMLRSMACTPGRTSRPDLYHNRLWVIRDGRTGPTIASGTKRMAMNEVAQTVGGGLQLRADFDDGVTDVLGDGLGLGAAEGMDAPGDSGGSAMLIGNMVMGISSYGTNVSGGPRPDFGDTTTTTRISQFIPYIGGIRDATLPLVIDMDLQEEGNDGVADAITLRRNARTSNFSWEESSNTPRCFPKYPTLHFSDPTTTMS